MMIPRLPRCMAWLASPMRAVIHARHCRPLPPRTLLATALFVVTVPGWSADQEECVPGTCVTQAMESKYLLHEIIRDTRSSPGSVDRLSAPVDRAVGTLEAGATRRAPVDASSLDYVRVNGPGDGEGLARADGALGTAVGVLANASGRHAVALGLATTAAGAGSTALGDSSRAMGAGATALGQYAEAIGHSSVAIGGERTCLENEGCVATFTRADGTNSVAIGASAKAWGNNAVALGMDARSRGAHALAAGHASQASALQAVALGMGADAAHDRAVALGALSITDRANSVSLGTANMTRQLTHLADGTAPTDAVNLRQLLAMSAAGQDGWRHVQVNPGDGDAAPAVADGLHAIAVGVGATASAWDTVAVGTEASATAMDSVAVGTSTQAAATGASAFGAHAAARGVAATALGYAALASGDASLALGGAAHASGAGATAIGKQAKAMGDSAVAIGTGMSCTENCLVTDTLANGMNSVAVGASATAGGDGSIALGTSARATERHALAFGSDAQAGADGSVAVGDRATSHHAGAVALGAGAITDRGHSVSVGAPGQLRQLTHVAAGTQDTDAVNKGQMQAAVDGASHGVVRYDNADTRDSIRLEGERGTTLSNLRAGRHDDDATNAGQLRDVARALGGGADLGGDGRLLAPVFHVQGQRYGTVGGAFDAVDEALGQLDERVTGLENGGRVASAASPASAMDAVVPSPEAPVSPAQDAISPDPVADTGTPVTTAASAEQVAQARTEAVSTAREYTDARVSQLDDRFSQLSDDVSRRLQLQDKRIDRMGAMSAAMLNMATNSGGSRSPRGRVGIGAGWQNGEKALALGWSRQLGERASVSVGGAFSGDDRSAGVGFGIDL